MTILTIREIREAYNRLLKTKPAHDAIEVTQQLYKQRAHLIVKKFGEGLTEQEEEQLVEIKETLDLGDISDMYYRSHVINRLLHDAIIALEYKNNKYHKLRTMFNKKLRRKLYRDQFKDKINNSKKENAR